MVSLFKIGRSLSNWISMVLIITDLPDEDLHIADLSLKDYGFDTSCELTVKKSLKYAIAAWDAT